MSGPQSWNGYSYALNNPMVNTDPTGMATCTTCSQGDGEVAPSNDTWSWGLWWGPTRGKLQQTAVDVTDTAVRYITAPRNNSCVAGVAAAMGASGGIAGGVLGTPIGAGGGAAVGVLGGPVGVGAVGIAGGIGGFAAGASTGTAIGGGVGIGVGWLVCSTNAGASGGGEPSAANS